MFHIPRFKLICLAHPTSTRSIAQVLIASSMCEAARNSRSPFLKSEAFRLLSTLVGTSAKETTEELSDIEKKGRESMYECSDSFVTSVVEALKDPEMKKAKRVRDILKTAEKLIDFLTKMPQSDSGILSSLTSLKDELVALKDGAESKGVTALCDSLNAKLETFIANSKGKVNNGKEDVSMSSKKKGKKTKRGKKK